jgi:arginyl-tRNA synthetase
MFTCAEHAKCWGFLVAKKEGKRPSVAQQIAEALRQWNEAFSSEDPRRAVEDMIAEYERTKPGVVNAQLVREALRQRLSEMYAAEFEKAPVHRPGSKPRAPRT